MAPDDTPPRDPAAPRHPSRRGLLRIGLGGVAAATTLLAGCQPRFRPGPVAVMPATPEPVPEVAAVPEIVAGPYFADRAVLFKLERTLVFYGGEHEVKRYSVAIGRGGPGPKRREGDALTPEGRYHMMPPGRPSGDGFRWFIPIDYPNAEDRERARQLGQQVPLGGAIGLHGTGDTPWTSIHARGDRSWTLGCLAVTNQEIDEIREMISYNGRMPFPIEMRG